jgi:hypothetical protein
VGFEAAVEDRQDYAIVKVDDSFLINSESIVKLFRKLSVENDDVLQPNVFHGQIAQFNLGH